MQGNSLHILAVSYNVHQCVGTDRRRDPGRIARVLKELDADFVGLQEVHSETGGTQTSAQMNYLAQATRREAVAGPTIVKGKSEYGNVLLTRHRVVAIRRFDLSVPGREARGGIDADIEINGRSLRVIVSHLGLAAFERRLQVQRLAEVVASPPRAPTILLMDHNEWRPVGSPLWRLDRELGKSPAPRTFPAAVPLFSLDRAWVRPARALVEAASHKTQLTKVASDHLPLKVNIDFARMFD